MGRLPASAAISVALHALVAACVVVRAVACESPGAARTAERAPGPDPVAAAEPPIEIELLPRDELRASHGDPKPAASVARALVTPTRRPLPSTSSPAAVASPDGPPARTNAWLAMRGAPDLRIHELGASPPAREKPAPGPAVTGVAPTPDAPAAPLAQPRSPDSGALDPTLTHEGFTLDVAPDGTAHLHDTRNVRFALHLPRKADLRDRIAVWRDLLDRDSTGQPDPPADPTRDDAPRPIANPIHDIGVTIVKFDVTDWLMRRHGSDPYASAKLNQLDATREERAQIGAHHAHAELARAAELVQSHLDALWASVRDPAERKQALFELWDECSETGSEDVVAASMHVRARILKFIRARLPPNTPGAFSVTEVAALNQHKQSAAVFAPYTED